MLLLSTIFHACPPRFLPLLTRPTRWRQFRHRIYTEGTRVNSAIFQSRLQLKGVIISPYLGNILSMICPALGPSMRSTASMATTPNMLRMTKYRKQSKAIYRASHVLMLECLPKRHIAMQLQLTNHHSSSNPYA